MKKSILNLGQALNREEQKQVNGGLRFSIQCSAITSEIDCVRTKNCNWYSSSCHSDRPHYEPSL